MDSGIIDIFDKSRNHSAIYRSHGCDPVFMGKFLLGLEVLWEKCFENSIDAAEFLIDELQGFKKFSNGNEYPHNLDYYYMIDINKPRNSLVFCAKENFQGHFSDLYLYADLYDCRFIEPAEKLFKAILDNGTGAYLKPAIKDLTAQKSETPTGMFALITLQALDEFVCGYRDNHTLKALDCLNTVLAYKSRYAEKHLLKLIELNEDSKPVRAYIYRCLLQYLIVIETELKEIKKRSKMLIEIRERFTPEKYRLS